MLVASTPLIRNARLLDRAQAQLTSGKLKYCLRLTEKILASDADHVGALEVRAHALWAVRDYLQTVVVTDRLILLNPFEPGYYSLKGAALQGLSRYGEAIRAYRRGIELGGESHAETSALFLQQCEESVLSDLLERDTAFREAYQIDPAAACHSRGLTLVARSATPDISMTRPS